MGLLPRRFLVSYKLLPPLQTPNELPRERIEALFDPDISVTLVNAPAGYGKTTALAQWYRMVAANGFAAGWLTLDEDDRDAVQFLSYIAAALDMPEEEVLWAEPSANTTLPLARPLSSLLRWAQERDRPTILFLDDVQRTQSSDSTFVLDELVHHLPANMRIVLASRGAPPCAVAELRCQGTVNEIGFEDLMFTDEEAGALFKNGLSEEKLHNLVERAEGWPIALQLIRLWLKGRTDFNVVETLSGRSKVLTDYLAEQVIENLEDDIQSFLMATAILERVNGDVAAALSGRQNAWLLLEELERRNLFLVPLDEERTWYRYHHLFAQFLEQRLERHQPGATENLHKRAAEWFAENSHIRDAIRHAMKVSDHEFVARFVDKFGGIELALRSGTKALSGIEKVAIPVTGQYPTFHLLQIYYLLQHNRTHEAWLEFEELRTGTKDFKDVEPSTALQASVIQFLLKLYMDEEVYPETAAEMENMLEAAQSTVPDILRPPVVGLVCCAYYLVSNYSKARAWGARAIAECKAFGASYAENYSRFFIGQAAMAQGHLREAERRYTEALHHAEDFFGRDGNQAATSRILLAEVRYEQDRLSEAGDLLGELPPTEELIDSWFSIYSSLYLTMSSLYARRWTIDACLGVLERAGEMASQRGFDRLRLLLNIHAVRELIRAGREQDAGARLKQQAFRTLLRPCTSFDERLRQLHESAVEADAAFQLLRSDGRAALRRLEPIAARASQEGRLRRLIKVRVMQAVAHEIIGDHMQSLKLFKEAVKHAAPEHYVRTFLDEGTVVHRLAIDTLALNYGLTSIERQFLKDVVAKGVAGSAADEPVMRRKQSIHLSPREREVLGFLNHGYSNKEIANTFGLTESTVKFYRRNLYRKLNVQTRAQAIAKGRSLLLI